MDILSDIRFNVDVLSMKLVEIYSELHDLRMTTETQRDTILALEKEVARKDKLIDDLHKELQGKRKTKR